MLPLTPLKKTITMLAADPLSIGAALGLGILATLIPYTLYVLALNYVEVSKASVLAIIEPVAATIIGLIAFNEVLTVNTVVAMVIILLSVLVANKKSKKTLAIVEEAEEIASDTWQAEKQISEKMAERRERKEDVEAAFSELDKE